MKWLLPLLFAFLCGNAHGEPHPSLAERCVQHYAMQYHVPQS